MGKLTSAGLEGGMGILLEEKESKGKGRMSKGRLVTENEEDRGIGIELMEDMGLVIEELKGMLEDGNRAISEVAEGQKKIFELVNRVVAEGIKMDWFLGLPGKVEDMQSDIDEIYRVCKNMPVMRTGFRTLKDRVAFLEERITAVLDKIDRELGKIGTDDNSVIVGILDTLDEILCELGKN